jgi:hypothetical protein
MDLSSLDSTLPPALADAERDMGDKFRGMFHSILEHASRCLSWSGWIVDDEGGAGHWDMDAHDYGTWY